METFFFLLDDARLCLAIINTKHYVLPTGCFCSTPPTPHGLLTLSVSVRALLLGIDNMSTATLIKESV